MKFRYQGLVNYTMKMRELSPLQIEKWYAIAVGEIGIPPNDFYDMTTDEMAWAYNGYKQRQQDIANIILLAIGRAQTEAHKNELFEFVENKGYDVGSLVEREEVFNALGI